MPVELTSIYKQIAEGKGKQYELLFSMVGLFSSVMEFDPVTDAPLPTTVDDVLYGIASFDIEKIGWQNDRLQHVVNFASGAIRNLIDVLHEKNLREYRIERPEKVREIDSKSMMWLAKKPGFTIKQKIASGQRMMGVFHTTSLDTAENRLFKSFMKQLDDLLLEKENACRKRSVATSDEFERFVTTVHSWLKSEEASLIGRWGNTPPNNTLLNDKNYRKIWKAHLMLQDINEQIEFDLSRLNELTAFSYFWLKAARLNQSDMVRFKQYVLFPNYRMLSLLKKNGSLECLYNKKEWKKAEISLDVNKQPEGRNSIKDIAICAESACKDFLGSSYVEYKPESNLEQDATLKCSVASVDLNSIKPTFHLDNGKRGLFSKKLIFQQLKDRSCSAARSKWISVKRNDVKTFTIHSIFDDSLRSAIDNEEKNKNAVAQACADFSKTIKDELCCQKCLYITNDDIDDFSPSVKAFKLSIHSAFPKVQILPRSIAVLFNRLSDIQSRFQTGDKFSVRTIYDSYEIVTEIRIAYSEELATQNPETKGLYFQRLRYNRISRPLRWQKNVPFNLARILTMQDAVLLKNGFSVDDFHFESNASVAKVDGRSNEIVVYASDDSSLGGIVYDRLQGISPDIPLWCDFLPRLSMKDSSGAEYVLVEPDRVSVRPIGGEPVSIPIAWSFIFPQGSQFYEFPLVQGEHKAATKYFAYITNSSFPLERDEKCRLNLTYTYGAPIPYNLEFIPVSDKPAFRSVTVKWENKTHKDYVHDMPVPNFVRELTWADMHHVSKRNSEKSSDLIKSWLPNEYDKINNSGVFKINGIVSSGTGNTNEFRLALSHNRNAVCRIESRYPADIGNLVWGYVRKSPDGFRVDDPHVVGSSKGECEFTKSLRFPAITLWNNGRSIYDADCPVRFRQLTEKTLQSLQMHLQNKDTPKCVADEYKLLLSCMHKDIPDWFYPYFTDVLDNINGYTFSWIAYALGDCSQDWQKELLKKVVSLLEVWAKRAYAIRIMAVAMWRVNGFIYSLSVENVHVIVRSIKSSIGYLLKAREEGEEKSKSLRCRLYTACLECIIALCRLRRTSEGKSASNRVLRELSPVTNVDVKIILSKMKDVKAEIKTFLSFDIEREAEDSTPELLYAAYGYLSGKIDSTSIKVLEAEFGE